MRMDTTGPISVTAAATSAGVWIAMATNELARGPTDQATAVGRKTPRSQREQKQNIVALSEVTVRLAACGVGGLVLLC